MKDAVEEVCEAISDVRQLLQENWEKTHSAPGAQPTAATEDNVGDWRIEWLREVDKLLKMDAGWGWEQFFRMISYNIREGYAAAPVRSSIMQTRLVPRFTHWLDRKCTAHLRHLFATEFI